MLLPLTANMRKACSSQPLTLSTPRAGKQLSQRVFRNFSAGRLRWRREASSRVGLPLLHRRSLQQHRQCGLDLCVDHRLTRDLPLILRIALLRVITRQRHFTFTFVRCEAGIVPSRSKRRHLCLHAQVHPQTVRLWTLAHLRTFRCRCNPSEVTISSCRYPSSRTDSPFV